MSRDPARPVNRRGFLRALACSAATTQVKPSGAACLEANAIRWIVPSPPGGGYDSYSRLLEPYLERELGLRVHIDNVVGAGGLRGASTLSEAPPDGSTLGIVNMPAILMAGITDPELQPTRKFSTLGTIAKSSYVWATGASSEIRSIEDVAVVSRKRGLVFGVSSFSSLGFLVSAIASSMLGWRTHFVSGYSGSADRALAATRGDVDLVALSWEVLIDRVRAGDLRPSLAIAGDVAQTHPELRGVPALDGPDGLIARQAPAAADDAEALIRFMQAGRVIVSPPGLEPDLERCLGDAVCRAISDTHLATAGVGRNLRIQPVCAAETRQRIRAARVDVQRLEQLASKVLAQTRK